jgi:hypothetical protein
LGFDETGFRVKAVPEKEEPVAEQALPLTLKMIYCILQENRSCRVLSIARSGFH